MAKDNELKRTRISRGPTNENDPGGIKLKGGGFSVNSPGGLVNTQRVIKRPGKANSPGGKLNISPGLRKPPKKSKPRNPLSPAQKMKPMKPTPKATNTSAKTRAKVADLKKQIKKLMGQYK